MKRKKRRLMQLDKEPITFKPHTKVVCPFCKKLFYMGKESDGTSAITHEQPACQEFLMMPVEAFLRRVRLIYSP